MGLIRYKIIIESFTLKAYAKVAAATDGDAFDRLVVIFLKRTFQCIRAATFHFCWLLVLGCRPIEIKKQQVRCQ